jgi:transposase InsO family protein
VVALLRIAARLIDDACRCVVLLLRSNESIRAENLFLRRQLALYMERGVRPMRIDAATRVSLTLLAKLFDWRSALVVVQPATMIRWHRAAWRLLWRAKSRAGRPRIPDEVRTLIRRMANENRLWGEERIANELLLKLGIRISPRTVRKYMPKRPRGHPRGDQRWSAFLKNHAAAILACDFFIAVTATFRTLYVFVVIEHGTRRLTHLNVTSHPSSEWALQQLREVVGDTHNHGYLIHDRDSIFAKHLDDSIKALGVEVLRSPISSPKANAICERLIGTIRRECLDWMIPMTEAHLRSILGAWKTHYNSGRPHSALGPGVPESPGRSTYRTNSGARHRLLSGALVRVKSVLGGLHHEYSLAATPASV